MGLIQQVKGPAVDASKASASPMLKPEEGGLRKMEFKAFGTNCLIQYVCPDAGEARSFEARVLDWVFGFQQKYSRYVEASIVSQINAAAGKNWVAVDPETEALLHLCDSLYFITQGVLDPTTLPITRLWKFTDPDPHIPGDQEVKNALQLVGWPKVKREKGRVYLPREGMALDFGGFGKEYAVDAVMDIIKEQNITQAMVDFGHDIRCLGNPPHAAFWHIGLEDPASPGSAWAGVALKDAGLASSGNYLRCFIRDGKRYGHIVDPRTGYPVNNTTLATYIVANSCLEAGILSTSTYILGATAGISLINSTFGTAGCIITQRERLFSQTFHNYLIKSI